MSPTDPTAGSCPFCDVPLHRIIASNSLAYAIRDRFPVTTGHTLVIPRRHVADYFGLHSNEYLACNELLGEIRESILAADQDVQGFNIGINSGSVAGQTIFHCHIHLIPRRKGDVENPRGGIRHIIPGKGNYNYETEQPKPWGHSPPHNRPLITGGDDALILHLLPYIDRAVSVDVAISFVKESGVRLLRPHLQDLLDRGGMLRLITGDYMDVSDPAALRHLIDLEGNVMLNIFEADITAFHPKSWVFRLADGTGIAIVGSSNLSGTALRTGVEWNYRVITQDFSGGWINVHEGFELLLRRPEVKVLSHDWIDSYERRRTSPIQQAAQPIEIEIEQETRAPQPHLIQQRALRALNETRLAGYTAGLVVLATGLGKTWLSAFDSNNSEFKRVLFVAHREEILSQAMETYRMCRPRGRFGRYSGTDKDLKADVLFASVQTLGRIRHLRNFSADAFDYIVIDEFHHAAARTYRAIIDYFTPKFLLGLTATPDRMDGSDLLGLCQENLVFRCDIFEGIEHDLLSRFSYFGIPDEVDYTNIPWRRASFDETALTEALATQARARNALDQYHKHSGTRTLGFCCSQLHADFMADFFNQHGMRAVSVHSGETSAPRTSSLEALEAGELDVIFSVDMFNEGVDIPNIDTILMLRPTQSSVIWMQQFGRGLRRSEDKERLVVIDYIGNHRIFLTKVRAMLQCPDGDRSLALRLEQLLAGEFKLPIGCDVTYDLEAIKLLRDLLQATSRGDALEAFYIDFRQRHGFRPTASEVYHAGFNPRVTGHGGWFDFIKYQGDLNDIEGQAYLTHGDFLNALCKTQMTRCYKMLLLRAMQQEEAFPGRIGIAKLTRRFTLLASRHPAFQRDVSIALDDDMAVQKLVERHPIHAWVNGKGTGGKAFFTFKDQFFETAFKTSATLTIPLNTLAFEIVDWRLAEYLGRGSNSGSAESEEDIAHSIDQGTTKSGPSLAPELWREYMREEIPPLYGLVFNTGSWNQGFLVQGKDVFLLVTLDKSDLQEGHKYADQFIDENQFKWQSQNRTSRSSLHGKIISGSETGYRIHLFVRSAKKRGGTAAPFIYCGDPVFDSWEGDRPISVNWIIPAPLPPHLLRLFGAG
jgi:superfamily II DNA or RNA helicase/diadenosine tetraphosphate (Ap4A) HIT family hydrolase/HKD family nuclease